VKPEAYMRTPRDQDGLSVAPQPEWVFEAIQPVGIAEIASSDVRSIRNPMDEKHLDVVLDTERHGNIINVPFWTNEPSPEQEAAERVSGDLARFSTLMDEIQFGNLKKRQTPMAG
jgi:hypothetical protein